MRRMITDKQQQLIKQVGEQIKIDPYAVDINGNGSLNLSDIKDASAQITINNDPQIEFKIYNEEQEELETKLHIDETQVVVINGAFKIGIEVLPFTIRDEGEKRPICNAKWTSLYPHFPYGYDSDGLPVFHYKLNNGKWDDNMMITGQDILMSQTDFNALAPTKLGLYHEEDKDFYDCYNISKIQISSTGGNALNYIWDEDQNAFVLQGSFTPLTGSNIGLVGFVVTNIHKPVYFEY